MNSRRLLLLVALVAGFGCHYCEDDDEVQNRFLDRWCGDRPCYWDVEGKIKRVGTWDDRDYAVSLVSDPAQVSHVSLAMADTGCTVFRVLAKSDSSAQLFFEIDLRDDGEVDWSQRIPAGDWKWHEFHVPLPSWYDSVRFILRKQGRGFAAVTQIASWSDGGCMSPTIELNHRPAEALCDHDDQCASGSCTYGECQACPAGAAGSGPALTCRDGG